MEQIKVVVADDADWIRCVVRDILAQHPKILVVGEAQNGEEALEKVKDHSPDVLILDMEMPALNGLGVIENLKRSGSDVRILVLSAFDDIYYIQGVLEHGAAGYLIKDEFLEGQEAWGHFVDAVQRAASGEKDILGERAARKLANGGNPGVAQP